MKNLLEVFTTLITILAGLAIIVLTADRLGWLPTPERTAKRRRAVSSKTVAICSG